MSTTALWLIAGVLCVIAEALGISGVGLLFAGLGALLAGLLTNLGFLSEEAVVSQFIVFFIATAAWALLLWKPIQKFRLNRHRGGYSNIVGETAYVGSNGLSKSSGGEVTWSGTIMKAQLAPHTALERLEAGSAVTIIDINGVTLTVKPKE